MIDFDPHAGIYSKKIEESLAIFGQRHDFFVRNKASILLDLLSESGRPPDMRLLDVGCGTGLVHPYLIDYVAELHGVDVSRESLSIARKNNPLASYVPYDGKTLPYENGAFDCAYAICVLHHVPVPQWQAVILEMTRVVRDGGIVIVVEHNPINPATQWVVRSGELDDGAILLWPRRLKHLFEHARLDRIATRYIQFTPFGGVFFRRLDAWLAGVPLGTQYVVHGYRRN